MKKITLTFVFLLSISAPDAFADSRDKALLELLAKRAISTTLSNSQYATTIHKLSLLPPEDVLMVSKLIRKRLMEYGVVTKEESRAFPSMERLDKALSDKIQFLFGPGKTIWNISQHEFSILEASIAHDSSIKLLMERADVNYPRTANDRYARAAASSDCYFDNNWSGKFSRTDTKSGGSKAGGSGRVKNDPNETCDFVLYVPRGKYSKVYGASPAVHSCILGWGGFNGLVHPPQKTPLS